MVALTLLPELVLTLQHDVHEESSTEQEQEHVGKDDTVASAVVWGLPLVVNVGGHDTVHVTPADNDTNHDTTLERTLDVVGSPCQRVGNCGVDPHGA